MNDAQVGRAFRAVRVRKLWRQRDVAAAAGVSQTTVSRIERGRLGAVPLDTLRRVAEALGMRVTLLAAWEGRSWTGCWAAATRRCTRPSRATSSGCRSG